MNGNWLKFLLEVQWGVWTIPALLQTHEKAQYLHSKHLKMWQLIYDQRFIHITDDNSRKHTSDPERARLARSVMAICMCLSSQVWLHHALYTSFSSRANDHYTLLICQIARQIADSELNSDFAFKSSITSCSLVLYTLQIMYGMNLSCCICLYQTKSNPHVSIYIISLTLVWLNIWLNKSWSSMLAIGLLVL